MTEQGNLRKQVELRFIASDLVWGYRVGLGIMAADTSVTSVLSLCLAPHLSLLVFESFRYLGRDDPTLSTELGLDQLDLIEQSRHRIKLFDDTRNDLDQTIEYMTEIAIAHQRRFIPDKTPETATPSEWDMGFWNYGDRPITNTRATHYHLGTGLDFMDSDTGDLMRSFGHDIGFYFSGLTREIQRDGTCFFSSVDGSKLNNLDVQSWEYYPSSFGGGIRDGIPASLSTFQSVMNTVDLFFGFEPSELTTFKLTYISMYHVIRALEQLSNLPNSNMKASARDLLSDALSDLISQRMLSSDTVPFRNTLMHYGLDTRIPTDALDESDVMAGLAQHFFPGEDSESLNAAVREGATRLATLLNRWSRL
jgi:hypothetical protein